MTEAEYRAYPGVNKSTLWEIRKSPMHYKWALENPGEDTAALRMGRAIHAMVLQPDEFDEQYAIAPCVDRRTKEGKAVWAQFCEENEGKDILTQDEIETVKATAKAVYGAASDLLAMAETEVPLFWDDRRTGIRCKCRVDAMKETADKFIMIDLKTTKDASTDAFIREAIRYGYHVQASFYKSAVETLGLNHGKPIEWWFVAVEKQAPFAVNKIRVSQSVLDEGLFQAWKLMDRLDECLRTDTWPGYGSNEMVLPEWAVSDGEED